MTAAIANVRMSPFMEQSFRASVPVGIGAYFSLTPGGRKCFRKMAGCVPFTCHGLLAKPWLMWVLLPIGLPVGPGPTGFPEKRQNHKDKRPFLITA